MLAPIAGGVPRLLMTTVAGRSAALRQVAVNVVRDRGAGSGW